MITIKEARTYFCKELSNVYSNSELNTIFDWCIEDICGITRVQSIGNAFQELSAKDFEKLKHIIIQLSENKPIQYILGHAWFYEWSFEVTPAVLIPRPETEELVQLIIQQCKTQNAQIFEVGTGSGCIAISLSKKLKNSRVTACDISPLALEVATRNAQKLQSDVSFIELDICKWQCLTDENLQLDCVVSNPPYICENEKINIKDNVLHHEPHGALFVPDNDPLLFYRHIAQFAIQHLKPDALLAVEINEQFGNETAQLFSQLGFVNISILTDLFGKQRIVTAKKNSI